MHEKVHTKSLLLKLITESLQIKVDDALFAIANAKESRDNDTKSSAGDKYETGRAMMQQEMDKNEIQLNAAKAQLQELSKLDLTKKIHKVEPGCVVITDENNYFISIGFGKLQVNHDDYYAISLASPIGLMLKNKSAGDAFEFRGMIHTIREIY